MLVASATPSDQRPSREPGPWPFRDVHFANDLRQHLEIRNVTCHFQSRKLCSLPCSGVKCDFFIQKRNFILSKIGFLMKWLNLESSLLTHQWVQWSDFLSLWRLLNLVGNEAETNVFGVHSCNEATGVSIWRNWIGIKMTRSLFNIEMNIGHPLALQIFDFFPGTKSLLIWIRKTWDVL